MKKAKYIFISLLLLVASYCLAGSEPDSLKLELSNTSNDNDRITILLELATSYADVNLDSANYYINTAQIILLSNPGIYNSAQYYYVKGLLFNKSFKNDSAVIFLKTSYSLYTELDSIKDQSRVLNQIATCFNDQLLYDSSIYYHNRSFEILDSIIHPGLYAANLNNIANAYDNIGDKNTTLNYYIRALRIFKELNQEVNVAITTNNIGIIYHELGNLEVALKHFNEAVELNLKNGNNRNLCNNYTSIGLIYKDLNQFDKALQYTKMAVEIAEKSNFMYTLAMANHNIGSIYFSNGEDSLALLYFQSSLKLSRELGIIIGEVFNLVNLGEVYTRQEKFSQSEELLLKGIELCRENHLTIYYPEFYDALMNNYQSWGKYQEAFNYYQKYTTIRDSLDDVLQEKELNEIQTRYETEQKEIENQKLKSQNELQEMVIFRQRLLVSITVFISIIAVGLVVMLITIRKKRKLRFALLQDKNTLIKEKSDQLNITNETKDRLFSIIAHDLRSPFGSLMGFSNLLVEEAEGGNFENTLYYAQQMSSATANTFELLDNLLNWSRSQQKNLKPSLAAINLQSTVGEILRSLKDRAGEKEITINNKIEDVEITTDKNMIMVIIRNLVSNAIKFTPVGGQIDITSKSETENITISIHDNGVGIEPDILKKLFSGTPGYTTRGTEKEQGSGLGLMLVNDFVERLGGAVWVESDLGHGSTFSFTTPK